MSKHLHYLPKLDALRAIAALMVLVAHYMIDVGGPHFDYGGNGVQIFFVISGFLIITILLSQKEKVHLPKFRLIRSFIIKRALRLFPIYFLVLSVIFLISIVGGLWICDKENWINYFTYTQNFVFFNKGFQSPLLNHTWSLAVEEQFYLFWPFLILLIPRKAELPTLLTVFLVGVSSRFYFEEYYPLTGTIKGMTLIHFDTLGAGALLAWVMYYRKERVLNILRKSADYLFLLGLLSSGLLTYFKYHDALLLPFSLTLMSASLVFICSSEGLPTFLNAILNISILQRLGKISYGVYLYHKMIPFFFVYAATRLHIPLPESEVIMFCIYTSLALIIASLSWRFIESPLLKVKERFDF